ncbi:MAG: YbhN family protein, partial [Parvibaculum sp.]
MWARYKHYVWPVIGLAAVAFSAWLLFYEIRHLSFEDVSESLAAIPLHRWLLASASTVLAYMALAEYDRLALNHLGRSLPWSFVATTSFTTYALAHNIGASVFSGAFVRYRAYTSQGLG